MPMSHRHAKLHPQQLKNNTFTLSKIWSLLQCNLYTLCRFVVVYKLCGRAVHHPAAEVFSGWDATLSLLAMIVLNCRHMGRPS